MSQIVPQLNSVEFRRNHRVTITDANPTINMGERQVLFGSSGTDRSTVVGTPVIHTFPPEGRMFILGHQLGRYDVFKLYIRIGLVSAGLGRQSPELEDPSDAVVIGLSVVAGR